MNNNHPKRWNENLSIIEKHLHNFFIRKLISFDTKKTILKYFYDLPNSEKFIVLEMLFNDIFEIKPFDIKNKNLKGVEMQLGLGLWCFDHEGNLVISSEDTNFLPDMFEHINKTLLYKYDVNSLKASIISSMINLNPNIHENLMKFAEAFRLSYFMMIKDVTLDSSDNSVVLHFFKRPELYSVISLSIKNDAGAGGGNKVKFEAKGEKDDKEYIIDWRGNTINFFNHFDEHMYLIGTPKIRKAYTSKY